MSLDKPRLLAELLDRHGAALALFARQWDAAGDDVVQEALIELSGLVHWPDNPVAWLFDVVRKRAISRGTVRHPPPSARVPSRRSVARLVPCSPATTGRNRDRRRSPRFAAIGVA